MIGFSNYCHFLCPEGQCGFLLFFLASLVFLLLFFFFAGTLQKMQEAFYLKYYQLWWSSGESSSPHLFLERGEGGLLGGGIELHACSGWEACAGARWW